MAVIDQQRNDLILRACEGLPTEIFRDALMYGGEWTRHRILYRRIEEFQDKQTAAMRAELWTRTKTSGKGFE